MRKARNSFRVQETFSRRRQLRSKEKHRSSHTSVATVSQVAQKHKENSTRIRFPNGSAGALRLRLQPQLDENFRTGTLADRGPLFPAATLPKERLPQPASQLSSNPDWDGCTNVDAVNGYPVCDYRAVLSRLASAGDIRVPQAAKFQVQLLPTLFHDSEDVDDGQDFVFGFLSCAGVGLADVQQVVAAVVGGGTDGLAAG